RRGTGNRMTLTRRLSLFFIAALTVVLVAFSSTLYLLADTHLTRQLDDRLGAAAGTLASAIEIGGGGGEGEPRNRPLATAPGVFGDQLRWAVTAEDGQVLDSSSQPGVAQLLAAADAGFRSGHRNPRRLDHDGRAWQVTRVRVAPEPESPGGVM